MVVRDVTFGVERSQIFGLIGPNGAGKSTTFNIVAGLIHQSMGEVYLNSLMQGKAATEFCQLGLCLQTNSLWDLMTPAEHLYLYGRIRGIKESLLARTSASFL